MGLLGGHGCGGGGGPVAAAGSEGDAEQELWEAQARWFHRQEVAEVLVDQGGRRQPEQWAWGSG